MALSGAWTSSLKPGQVNQEIVVSGEQVPVVETSTDTLGGSFESNQVEDLPINGRDYTKMLIHGARHGR